MIISVLDHIILTVVNIHCRLVYRKLIKRCTKQLRKLDIYHRKMHLAMPETGNEKFLWRKIFDHDPRFIMASDKLRCKQWIATQNYNMKISDIIWQAEHDDITTLKELSLTQDIVLKANHGSGTNEFIKKGTFDAATATRKMQQWLAFDHGDRHGEWGYFGIDRRIFAEQWIEPQAGTLSDIKLYLFSGKILRIAHILGGPAQDICNTWNLDQDGRPVQSKEAATIAKSDYRIPLPDTITDAIDIGYRIGAEFDHVRVDFLTDGNDLWFGELTLYNQGGYLLFPSASDPQSEVSRTWDIRTTWFLNTEQPGWRGCYARALRRSLDRH